MPFPFHNEIAIQFTDVASRIVDTFGKATDDLTRRSRVGPRLGDGVNELAGGDLRGYGQVERATSRPTDPWAARTPADRWREGSNTERAENLGANEIEQNTRRWGENSAITDPERPEALGPRGGRRSEISPEEARELYEQARDREPDFAGAGNRINLVDTSVGPAVVRSRKEEPVEAFLKKWMPENTAIEYARECDVRTPKILYAGTDPTTGTEFTIMQYIPHEIRSADGSEMLNWLPDLLDQVQSMSSHAVPAGLDMDIPEWQRQMIQHADDSYHNLPQDQRSRLAELGIGPLSEYIRPDSGRAGEPAVFAHNDLYPSNLRLDDRGELWILDWELAGPGDPIHNASLFLERLWGTDEATRAQATAMWIERISPANPGVDIEAGLGMYRTMADWRGTVMGAAEMRPSVTANPGLFETWVDLYHERFSRNSTFPEYSRDELHTLLRGWVE
ncbi:aminoglycoside phosphotransferase family protein [Nocardia sp. NPDC004568]|uniref:aminoglycoside phosphotransferase family protein n=1 Tax=Nocardia sp. NPDC004568 TaxID=3154551 RepID=UPI0033B3D6BB